MTPETPSEQRERRGQNKKTPSADLSVAIRETERVWRKHHLTYDQTKKVVEQTRHHLGLSAPSERRRTVDRLDRSEVERLIAAAYRRSSLYGLLVKTLFYTGARVSELTRVRVEDVYFDLEPPQVRFTHAKKGSDRFVPILPSLAQE